jgi:protein gp37
MTSIEWVKNPDGSQGKTWNPVVGCSIVSPGCTNCYAMKMAARIEAMGNQPRYAGTTKKVNGNGVWTGKLAQAPDSALLAPLRRKKPTTYFVNSMSDLFHESAPNAWIDRVFAVMALAPQHTFQVLTKRAERMREYITAQGRFDDVLKARDNLVASWDSTIGYNWPPQNVWLGVSCERQQEADERIPLLLQTPAAVRFISAEPLLGPIDLTRCGNHYTGSGPLHLWRAGGEQLWRKQFMMPPPEIDWVIAGAESGHGARECNIEWVRGIKDQCIAAGVAFFWKQHAKNGKKIRTPELDGRKWIEMPEVHR